MGRKKTGHFLYNIELCVKTENNRMNIILSYYLLKDKWSSLSLDNSNPNDLKYHIEKNSLSSVKRSYTFLLLQSL